MNVMKTVVLAAALACSAVGASAESITLGDSVAFAGPKGTTFDNTYDFSLTSAATLETIFTVSSDISFSATLFKADNSGLTAPVQVGFESLSKGFTTFDNPLAAGNYYYVFSGSTSGKAGGGYVAQISTVSAVPEPASVALLVAGLGMMGFVARRRKN